MANRGSTSNPLDTSSEAARAQREAYARMDGAERLELAMELSSMTRELTAAGLRRRLGLQTEAEVRAAVVHTYYGEDLPASEFVTSFR